MSAEKHDPDLRENGPAAPRRILLKASGEALMGENAYGVDPATVERLAERIVALRAADVEIALVVGGGNIFRGLSASAKGMPRAQADYMGMLATVMNALAVQAALEAKGAPARVQSALPMGPVCEAYDRAGALAHLAAGRIVIFAAGTGAPFFTTDTAAVLRALEMGCEALWKGTQVDGVYDSDPRDNPDARRYDVVSYDEVLVKQLNVMDMAAIALARDNALPVIVFSLETPGGFTSILNGEGAFTEVRPDAR